MPYTAELTLHEFREGRCELCLKDVRVGIYRLGFPSKYMGDTHFHYCLCRECAEETFGVIGKHLVLHDE